MRAVALAMLLLTTGSQTIAAPARNQPAVPPPYQGVYQPRGIDEIGLWREDDESERRLAASNLVVRDEALTGYVKGVLCRAVGSDRCGAARIYIMREPSFNATMSPNGTMRVYSGLLLRVHSEAELAAVLGHEFGHFEQRHSVERFKSRRSSTDLLAWAAVLASFAPSYDVRRSYQNLELSVYGNFYRYQRDHEREADLLGIAYLNKSELRPQAAARVWQNVMAEAEASTRARGLSKPNFDAIAFTATHPPNAERAGYLADLALPEAATRGDGAEAYRAAVSRWLPVFLDDQIKLNDFGGSEYVIQQLANDGWTPWLWFARGELYRTRGNPRDLTHAIEFYGQAIALDGGMSDAYRGLGLSLMKTGQNGPGLAALRKYLELKPHASDGRMIRMMLPAEVTAK